MAIARPRGSPPPAPASSAADDDVPSIALASSVEPAVLGPVSLALVLPADPVENIVSPCAGPAPRWAIARYLISLGFMSPEDDVSDSESVVECDDMGDPVAMPLSAAPVCAPLDFLGAFDAVPPLVVFNSAIPASLDAARLTDVPEILDDLGALLLPLVDAPTVIVPSYAPLVCFDSLGLHALISVSDCPSVFASPSQDLCRSVYWSGSDVSPVSYLAPAHVTREQRLRCDRVEMVHLLTHCSDDILCAALTCGEYSWAHITSTDVRLNRRLRGPCVQCLEGKFRGKPMSPSDTPPATCVGGLISFDTQALLAKSPGGNAYCIDSFDEFSGDIQVSPAKSLKALDLFNGLMNLVYVRYNAYGHRVYHMMGDALPALEPVIPMLGAMGILLTLAPPGQHAQRMERADEYLNGRRRATLASLSFVVPNMYVLHARAWTAEGSNALPNSQSSPYPTLFVSDAEVW